MGTGSSSGGGICLAATGARAMLNHDKERASTAGSCTVSARCMRRVNDVPVKFERVKGKPSEFIIGAVAGPQAKVTARYCIGSHVCNEGCPVPRDDFAEAIGASEDEGGTVQISQWEAADPKSAEKTARLNAELKRDLSDFEEAGASSEQMALFQDWVGDSGVPACGSKQASL